MSQHDAHVFDPGCRGCQPAMLDVKTGLQLPEDHPATVAVLSEWVKASRAEQEAYHEFTVKNSRDQSVLELVNAFTERVQKALGELSAEENGN